MSCALALLFAFAVNQRTYTSVNAGVTPECVSSGGNATLYSRETAVLVLLNNAQSLIEDAKKFSQMRPSCPCDEPIDCADIYRKDPKSKSGVYKIWPRSRLLSSSIQVYCDMDDDGGQWTVIQRRGDYDSGRDYFYRDWNSYKIGFGDLSKDFWLGNDYIHALTNQRRYTLKFELSDWQQNKTYAIYEEFYVEDESHKYAVHVTGYRGSAGDSFSATNGASFSTKEQDNDKWEKNCAEQFKGAWWYVSCHSSNLNGQYLKGPHDSHANGVNWKTFRGHNYSLKDTVMKVRPLEFERVQDRASVQDRTSTKATPQ